MKIPVLTLDAPNKNGRIYPKEVMENAIAKYKKEFVDEKRAMIVKKLPESSCVNLLDVIGTVKEITIENGKVVINAEFLPGMAEALLIESQIKGSILHVRTHGIGSMKKDANGHYVLQDDYEFISCFVTHEPA